MKSSVIRQPVLQAGQGRSESFRAGDGISRFLRWLIRREEKRLNLPEHWVGTADPVFAFMVRLGPWMVNSEGVWREYRRVSRNGKIVCRDWKRVWPKKEVSTADRADGEDGKRSQNHLRTKS